jgi:hypothetical protein
VRRFVLAFVMLGLAGSAEARKRDLDLIVHVTDLGSGQEYTREIRRGGKTDPLVLVGEETKKKAVQ